MDIQTAVHVVALKILVEVSIVLVASFLCVAAHMLSGSYSK